MNDLALLYRRQGKLAQAESLLDRALEDQGRTLGTDHPDTLTTMNNLALVYQVEGKRAQAEPLFVAALEGRHRVLGAEHPETLISAPSQSVSLELDTAWDQNASAAGRGIPSRSQNR
jgi:tetratricopeptide (TPR) repeat protein